MDKGLKFRICKEEGLYYLHVRIENKGADQLRCTAPLFLHMQKEYSLLQGSYIISKAASLENLYLAHENQRRKSGTPHTVCMASCFLTTRLQENEIYPTRYKHFLFVLKGNDSVVTCASDICNFRN